MTPANPSIAAGTNQQFVATGTYSDATTAVITGSVTWASATPATATISASGLAHGVAVGTSSISATLGSVSGSTVLTVTAATLTSIAVTPANPSIVAGTNQQFVATGTYSDATTAVITGSVTWASATTSVATISAGGLAHAVAAGTSSISATLGSVSGSTILTVTPATKPVPVLTYTGPTSAVLGRGDHPHRNAQDNDRDGGLRKDGHVHAQRGDPDCNNEQVGCRLGQDQGPRRGRHLPDRGRLCRRCDLRGCLDVGQPRRPGRHEAHLHRSDQGGPRRVDHPFGDAQDRLRDRDRRADRCHHAQRRSPRAW